MSEATQQRDRAGGGTALERVVLTLLPPEIFRLLSRVFGNQEQSGQEKGKSKRKNSCSSLKPPAIRNLCMWLNLGGQEDWPDVRG
jgi:hypothetical protein